MGAIYTRIPRATMWLLRGGDTVPGGVGEPGEIPPFYIAKAPITNVQYEAYDPQYRRSPRSPGDDDPVVEVSLEEASAYCRWYSELANKRFRLPTEQEWEFACCWGQGTCLGEGFQWDAENSDGQAMPVEGKVANDAGIHDMLGSVWEWTSAAVLRGGSYRSPRTDITWTMTRPASPGDRFDDAGFRILRLLRG